MADERSKYSVKYDKWDWELFCDLLREVQKFSTEHNILHKTVENAPELWADAFWSLWKIRPSLNGIEDMKPSHMIDVTVMEALQELEDYASLHQYCRGDHLAATQAAITLRPRIEEIWDKLDKHQQLAKDLEKLQDELRKLLQEQVEQMEATPGMGMPGSGSSSEDDEDSEEGQGSGEGEGEGGGQDENEEGEGQGDSDEDPDDSESNEPSDSDLQDRIDKIQKLIEELEKQMKEERDAQMVNIRQQLSQGVSQALADQSNMEAVTSLGYGTTDGTLKTMNLDERLELAKKINNDKFKKVADLLGPMQRYMYSARRRKTKDADEEIVDITAGNELDKVVPSEFAKLQHKYARLLFMKEFFGENLPQYELQGVETVAKGEIIVNTDTSGSMHGSREMWAKAVGLALLHLSRQQKRGFFGIHFSNRGQFKEYDFGKESDFSIDNIVAFAGDNFYGGTDFKTPLERSLKRLQEQHKQTGETKADVVFISDGECWVDDDWLKNFKAEQERLDFRVWGVLVGGARTTKSLDDICDGRVISTADIVSGKDLDKLWQGM